MGLLDAVAAAALQGDTVVGATLVELAFASGTARIHAGHGPLSAAGQIWDGIGGLIKISDIDTGAGGAASPVTLTLEGVTSASINDFRNAETEIYGRLCRILFQFFDPETFAPIGNPVVALRGRMDQLTHSAADANTWTMDLTVTRPFSRRGLPPLGNLTDRDQQTRYPGDRGLFLMQAMINRRRPWDPTIPDS
ncbi:hypothetical protein ADL19_19710 [Streptomyces purpurogeneiscleroticus]|nr:hypothetical protein ADL19_19710 [Streptomyces purpurogeneiscleroticus]